MGEPIRVLHVIGIMNRGGAETMIMNLYRNIDRTKVQFDFVENSFEPAVFDEEIRALGGRIYRCPHYNGKNHFQYKKWWDVFFNEHHEYRIIHGHLGSTAAIYLRIAKKYGIYTIAHSHSAGGSASPKSIAYCAMSYGTRNIADYFFACSSAAGIDRYGKAVTSNREIYKVLNNAIDTKAFAFNLEVRRAVRKQFGYEDNAIVLGHVGRFTPEKNHEFILNVFQSVLKKNGLGQLILVGDGPLRNHIQQTAKNMGIVDRVIFTGVRDDVHQIMQAMDVLVFPSLYEGLPVTLIEAQASGLPCVISDRIPDECIITDGVISVKSLNDSAEVWSEHIMERIQEQREDRAEVVRAHGYDIAKTAKWLGEFYLEKYSAM